MPDGDRSASRNPKSTTFISPVVARMAAHHGLDLAQISGTGRNGRVRKKDVETFLARGAGKPDEIAQEIETTVAIAKSDQVDLLPLTSMRRAIAKRMSESKQTIPHVTAVVEVDLQQITAHRKAHKEAFAMDGVNLTYMAYFAVAVAQALKSHRIVNSSWSDEGIVLHRQVNLGIATDLGARGLIVPVVKNAADLSLLGAARAIGTLAENARDGTLSQDQTRSATYTITNYGSNGTLHATPIIAPPQCAILGLGKIERRPVVRILDGEEVIIIRPMVYMTHTYDHRILDGGTSARFLRDVIEKIESWK
jgi:2-oxoglutarate dehydrogenase E2 component (dihydrolipoamide succinyltransferase)